jgi:hypothetical protein
VVSSPAADGRFVSHSAFDLGCLPVPKISPRIAGLSVTGAVVVETACSSCLFTR